MSVFIMFRFLDWANLARGFGVMIFLRSKGWSGLVITAEIVKFFVLRRESKMGMEYLEEPKNIILIFDL